MPPRHVYVHVPFCARRCSYCDFAIAVRRSVPADDYLRALARELELRFPPGDQWEAETVYLGGGTPSLLGAAGVGALVDVLRRRVTLAEGAEVTLEANPDDVTPASVAGWRAAAVNRLSLGAQSFDDAALAWMRRTHTASAIGRAVAAARTGGIDNISLDLIFALPPAVGRSWEADLDAALALRPHHLSLYGLTIEAGTALARWRERGSVAEAPEERYEREFLVAHERLAAAGYEHYEVSSYALPGHRSHHNSVYWSLRPYAGLGPSAHEYDGATRRWNVRPYAEWVRRLAQGRAPTAGSEELTAENREAERVYLALRTERGLCVSLPEVERTRPWVAAGWASLADARLRLTPTGWLRLDTLAADLTAFRSPS